MKTSTISALLLVLAIAQTQAFFTLFQDEFRHQPNRQMTEAEAMEAEAEATETETEASAEQQGPVEPVNVSKNDITLLRRDILFSLERLRQTIESQAVRALRMPNTWHYPYHPSNAQQ